MQTANTQDRPDGELQRSYAWGPDETAMVNAIIGAAWDNQMSLRSGLRHTLSQAPARDAIQGPTRLLVAPQTSNRLSPQGRPPGLPPFLGFWDGHPDPNDPAKAPFRAVDIHSCRTYTRRHR